MGVGEGGANLTAEPRMHLQVLAPGLGQEGWKKHNGFSSPATGSQREEALEDYTTKCFWNTCNCSVFLTSRLKGKANTVVVELGINGRQTMEIFCATKTF